MCSILIKAVESIFVEEVDCCRLIMCNREL